MAHFRAVQRSLSGAQIALIDAAVRAIAVRDEPYDDNPLAAACRAGSAGPAALARIFSTAPGAYGAGLADMHQPDRDAIGAAYLAAASHAYGGAEGGAMPAPGAFTARVAAADLLLHSSGRSRPATS